MVFVFIQSIVAPQFAVALTGGKFQQEYASYEEPGSTDMVNLLTGDFNFSLPVLDVPSPEGSFSLPLSYHAGISPEQEATWVGLGWSLNPGSITRNIVAYPDDAKGETESIHVQDLTGLRGWSSSIPLLWDIGWNNQVGNYGSVHLLNTINFTYDKSGVQGDPLMVFRITSAIISAGSTAAKDGLTFAEGLGKSLAQDMLSKAPSAIGASLFSGTPSISTKGLWEYSHKVQQKLFHKNYWYWLDQTRVEEMYGTLNYQDMNLDTYTNQYYNPAGQSSSAKLNTALKVNGVSQTLKEYPRSNSVSLKGVGNDMTYYMSPYQEYHRQAFPTNIGYDNYSVSGPGISGAIRPYRFEIGSVSVPREMTKNHSRLAPVSFMNYKVPFIYQGNTSNSYYHHNGGTTSPDPNTFNWGIEADLSNSDPNLNTSLTHNLSDVIFGSSRISSEFESTRRIQQKRNIEWFTNNEINTGSPFNLGFIDFLTGTNRTSFRTSFDLGNQTFYSFSDDVSNGIIPIDNSDINKFSISDVITLTIGETQAGTGWQTYTNTHTVVAKGSNYIQIGNVGVIPTALQTSSVNGLNITVVLPTTSKPLDGIGGYSITNSDGNTYHYALPLYEYENHSEIIDKTDANKKTVIDRNDAFANNWLLTSITGSDYVDRNANGIVDDGDWGYWVSLNYGKYTEDYQWREPYEGYTRDPENKYDNFSRGKKQLYYLNSIRTRTHTAIFIKGVRQDARSINSKATLKLDDIYLLTNEDYNELINTHAQTSCLNTINKLWLTTGISSPVLSFIQSKTLKRISFVFDDSLCKNTPNSFSANTGKLTLTRLAVYGRNSQKTVPDYLFEYGYNPDFQSQSWDGWGLYSGGSGNHLPSPSNLTPSAWSMTKVITPLGNEINIAYERDDYSSISGAPVTYEASFDNEDDWSNGITIDNPNAFSIGDQLAINGNILYECIAPGGGEGELPYSFQTNVIEVGTTYIKVAHNPPSPPACSGTLNIENSGVVSKSIVAKGGNLRVKYVSTTDEFGEENKISYYYVDETGKSTGAVSKEPEYINSANYSQQYDFNLPDLPMTPVMYAQVTVVHGTSASGYHTKQVYEFEVPNKTFITSTRTDFDNAYFYSKIYHKNYPYQYSGDPNTYYKDHDEFLLRTKYEIQNRSAQMGSVKSIKIYDQSDNLRSSTEYFYEEDLPNNQGIYTEGSLKFDRIIRYNSTDSTINLVTRTNKKFYPWVLNKIVNTSDGLTETKEYKAWDFFSGNPTELISTSALGVKVKQAIIPAYTVYPELGPKSLNSTNNTYKHMLDQVATEYSYLLDNNENIVGLLGGSATVWKKDWGNYRYLNGGTYESGTEGPAVWRIQKKYAYVGQKNDLRADGSLTYNVANNFNHSSGTNSNWLLSGETKFYNHYSADLENADLKDLRTAKKYDLNEKHVLAKASNASYFEMAYSGAEDGTGTPLFFGGEVERGNGSIVSGPANSHSGEKALSLSSGNGFIFKSTALRTDKLYRASVWTNSLNGRIYYKLDGGAEVLSAAPNSSQYVGSWYLLNFEIPIGSSFTSLEVGVKSATGTVIFDDFRFQPVEAAMTCYVYNQDTNELEYVLDNNNLYMKYEYNDRGFLIKTYKESIKYHAVKLISENSEDYKRFHVQQ